MTQQRCNNKTVASRCCRPWSQGTWVTTMARSEIAWSRLGLNVLPPLKVFQSLSFSLSHLCLRAALSLFLFGTKNCESFWNWIALPNFLYFNIWLYRFVSLSFCVLWMFYINLMFCVSVCNCWLAHLLSGVWSKVMRHHPFMIL